MKNWLKEMGEKRPVMYSGWECIYLIVIIIAGSIKLCEWWCDFVDWSVNAWYGWKSRKEGYKAGKSAAEEEDFED